jgi:hypothetical protein
MGSSGYKRKYPKTENLMKEFNQVLIEYTEEMNFLHTRYIADFVMRNQDRYPKFNIIKNKSEMVRKITVCFAERNDFEIYHTTRQGNNGTVWHRIEPGEMAMAGVREGAECPS